MCGNPRQHIGNFFDGEHSVGWALSRGYATATFLDFSAQPALCGVDLDTAPCPSETGGAIALIHCYGPACQRTSLGHTTRENSAPGENSGASTNSLAPARRAHARGGSADLFGDPDAARRQTHVMATGKG